MDSHVKIGLISILEGLAQGPVLINDSLGTDYLHDGITKGTYFAAMFAGSGAATWNWAIVPVVSDDGRMKDGSM